MEWEPQSSGDSPACTGNVWEVDSSVQAAAGFTLDEKTINDFQSLPDSNLPEAIVVFFDMISQSAEIKL